MFSYLLDLDRRIRRDSPFRLIRETVAFDRVREEVAEFYGTNGNVSEDPQPTHAPHRGFGRASQSHEFKRSRWL